MKRVRAAATSLISTDLSLISSDFSDTGTPHPRTYIIGSVGVREPHKRKYVGGWGVIWQRGRQILKGVLFYV